MIARQFRRKGGSAAALGVLGLLVAGCVESSTPEQAALERDQARYAVGQRDRRIQELQWQFAYLGQQMQAVQQRDEASQRALLAQLTELKEQNQALSDRLTTAETIRVQRPPAPAPEASSGSPKARRAGDAAAVPARPEDIARVEQILNAQHTQLVEMLARIEKLVRSREAKPNSRPERGPNIDLLDPLGYGDRR